MSRRCMTPTHDPSACTNIRASAAPANRHDQTTSDRHCAWCAKVQIRTNMPTMTQVTDQCGQAVNPASRRLRPDISADCEGSLLGLAPSRRPRSGPPSGHADLREARESGPLIADGMISFAA